MPRAAEFMPKYLTKFVAILPQYHRVATSLPQLAWKRQLLFAGAGAESSPGAFNACRRPPAERNAFAGGEYLELLAENRRFKEHFEFLLLLADLAIENWLAGGGGELIAEADLLLLAGTG